MQLSKEVAKNIAKAGIENRKKHGLPGRKKQQQKIILDNKK
ncbi:MULTISPECIES: hypothetical protein [Bacillus cereus group]|nr:MULTISPECIES: hypothetical protein [Bacillus cereus group]